MRVDLSQVAMLRDPRSMHQSWSEGYVPHDVTFYIIINATRCHNANSLNTVTSSDHNHLIVEDGGHVRLHHLRVVQCHSLVIPRSY